MEKKDTICAFEKVFDEWQKAMDRVEPEGRVIQYATTSDFEKAHIRLVFVHPYMDEEVIECDDGVTRTFPIPSRLDGKGGILAYVPKGSQTIFFDQSEDWVKMGGEGLPLFDIALHEIGHCHDIGHSSIAEALMSAIFSRKKKGMIEDDYEALNASWSKVKKNISEGSYIL